MVTRVHDKEVEDLVMRAFILWEKSKKKAAFQLFLQAAKSGNTFEASVAQHNVGFFYDIGEGIKKNHKMALYWYKKAWKNSSQTDSCENIASMYLTDGNRKCALYWWKKAVNCGDREAMLDLAKYYLSLNRKDLRIKATKLLESALKNAEIPLNISENAFEEIKQFLRRIKKHGT